ncbi:hypothetical protein DFP93_101239 [Aneurinibacillus soli]|uniref:Uncharacterized protein n=2 Tax=Aneurinibacillus soli TaxID=1500254 RepID=A0A0U5B0P8_9BACL|nr:hypothetical protein [Aneurinibacillus soli]PYE64213.1 hypothetical protein DFP93_101239 [Aneurinibacillus soli]BAU28162.1 hypothetical protein CB4_02336 [Aneurinibacillus soli]
MIKKLEINIKSEEIISSSDLQERYEEISQELNDTTIRKYVVFKENKPDVIIINPLQYELFLKQLDEYSMLRKSRDESVEKFLVECIEKVEKNTFYYFCEPCHILFSSEKNIMKKEEVICPTCYKSHPDSKFGILDIDSCSKNAAKILTHKLTNYYSFLVVDQLEIKIANDKKSLKIDVILD